MPNIKLAISMFSIIKYALDQARFNFSRNIKAPLKGAIYKINLQFHFSSLTECEKLNTYNHG